MVQIKKVIKYVQTSLELANNVMQGITAHKYSK